jgi:hypothetical protein
MRSACYIPSREPQRGDRYVDIGGRTILKYKLREMV